MAEVSGVVRGTRTMAEVSGGGFYLPAVSCEAMYDNSVYARKKGKVVEVVKRLVQ